MPFTLVPQVAKSDDTPPHVAMAEAHEQHLAEQPGGQMARNARRPLRDDNAEVAEDDEAVKAVRQHPDTGRWMAQGETAFGASSGPLAEALALHRPASPLASLVTAPGPAGGALASSISSNQGTAVVAHLDYRQGSGPVATAVSPIRPADHTAPNGPRQ